MYLAQDNSLERSLPAQGQRVIIPMEEQASSSMGNQRESVDLSSLWYILGALLFLSLAVYAIKKFLHAPAGKAGAEIAMPELDTALIKKGKVKNDNKKL